VKHYVVIVAGTAYINSRGGGLLLVVVVVHFRWPIVREGEVDDSRMMIMMMVMVMMMEMKIDDVIYRINLHDEENSAYIWNIPTPVIITHT